MLSQIIFQRPRESNMYVCACYEEKADQYCGMHVCVECMLQSLVGEAKRRHAEADSACLGSPRARLLFSVKH